MKDKRAVQSMARATVRTGHISSRKERVEDDFAISAVVVVTIALYALMFIGLCDWSHHSPIFAPNSADATTTQQVMPWS
jgi:hypothetical protein